MTFENLVFYHDNEKIIVRLKDYKNLAIYNSDLDKQNNSQK